MCKSLADGGLRCGAHIRNDIANITAKYEKGLETAASEASVPLNPAAVQETQERYEAAMETLKGRLLTAHQAAVDSKTGKINSSATSTMAEFSSVGQDLAGVKNKIKARFDRLVEIAEGAPTNAQILANPVLNQLPRKDEYIASIHLLKEYQNQLNDVHEEIKNADGFDNSKSISDFPEQAEKLDVLRQQKQAVLEYMQPMRKEYMAIKRATHANVKDIAPFEYQIEKTPRPKATKTLDLAIKTKVFKDLKQEYEDRAKAGFDENIVRRYASEKNIPVYDPQALNKFKTEVYDKTNEAISLKADWTEKQKQLQLTPGYRNKLESEAERALDANDIDKANQLRAKKNMLDRAAENVMAKNRKRAELRAG